MKLNQLIMIVLATLLMSNAAQAAGDVICFPTFVVLGKQGEDHLVFVRAKNHDIAYAALEKLSKRLSHRKNKPETECIKRQDLVAYDTAQDGFISYDDRRLGLALRPNTKMICEIPNNDHPEDIIINQHCRISAL